MNQPRWSPDDHVSPNDPTPIEGRPEVPRKQPGEAPGILDQPARIKRWMHLLGAVAVLLLLVDLFYTPHFHADLEAGWGKGFYGVYGFLGLVVLVLGAKALRLIVMRPEDYHDE